MSGTEKIRTIATPLKQRKEKREQKKIINAKITNHLITHVLMEKWCDTKQIIGQKKPDSQ